MQTKLFDAEILQVTNAIHVYTLTIGNESKNSENNFRNQAVRIETLNHAAVLKVLTRTALRYKNLI